jgi:hypothetical protein
MAITDELLVFVRDSLARGLPRAQIEDVLLKSGSSTEQTRAPLAARGNRLPFGAKGKTYLSAREAFLSVLLHALSERLQLGSLVFQFIDRAYPDPAMSAFVGGAEYVRQAIRWNVSSIIVAFPVFVYMSWLVSRDLAADPNKRHSKVRRWLTYLTLFIASSVLIGPQRSSTTCSVVNDRASSSRY